MQHLGLVDHGGQLIKYKQQLLRAQERFFALYKYDQRLNIDSTSYMDPTGHNIWRSTLYIRFPRVLTTEGIGLSQRLAERNAAVMAFYKLKVREA